MNNRLLYPDEKKILAGLQEGKLSDEQQKLADAACALIHCSYGTSPRDAGYADADAVASQNRGTDYVQEQNALRASGMFGYSLKDVSAGTATF